MSWYQWRLRDWFFLIVTVGACAGWWREHQRYNELLDLATRKCYDANCTCEDALRLVKIQQTTNEIVSAAARRALRERDFYRDLVLPEFIRTEK